MADFIEIEGACENNLRNIDVKIPSRSLTVITGLSGSGKSSLAFNTIFAEGQRRYLDTFSAYARQYFGNLDRPKVDYISGLSPVISIEQKTTNKNPRSTVGTVTEIYDFLRLLFARASDAFSYLSGEKMVKYSDEQIIELIQNSFPDNKLYIAAPIVRNRKGHYKELFEKFSKKGFINIRIDEEIKEIVPGMKLDRYKNHNIELIVDKTKSNNKDRLKRAVIEAAKQGNGVVLIIDYETRDTKYFSRHLMCPQTGLSYDEPEPFTFSFNSPKGACETCNGLGYVKEFDEKKIIPDKKLSVYNGGIAPLGAYKNTLIFWQLEAVLEKHGATLKTPLRSLSKEALNEILIGSKNSLVLKNTPLGASSGYVVYFEGIMNYLSSLQDNEIKTKQSKIDNYISEHQCDTCSGQRLKKESLHFLIDNKNIAEVAQMELDDLYDWFVSLPQKLSARNKKIATEILKELTVRTKFLIDVGVNYLCLDRQAKSLSGGESQRIRLATQIGSKLINVLYILDEPSIGLHQRDNDKLIQSLKQLRDSGNTVIVVEHDKEMMLNADFILDLGPGAGKNGGHVVGEGSPNEFIKSNSLTAKYLTGYNEIEVPRERLKGNGHFLSLYGASGNNLKNIDFIIPLGCFVCVTGVSGSGKSSVVNQTLYPYLSNTFYPSNKKILPFKDIKGIEHINKVIEVDQSPIGKTPRSNPATYTDVFTEIRKLFVKLPEAQIRAYKPGRFSFNVVGGRCETCKGAGLQTIEMNFLPDVYVTCKTCGGKRYNRETLEIRYKGKSISDVLDMSINEAVDFFDKIPKIKNKLKTLKEVGLGYIKLGQSSTTLSGGEAQRVKLATELSKKDTGKTLFILDEPTTGLHFEDIKILLDVLNKLVKKGNTVLIIEHNLDVIKVADYIIDIGPEGGKNGGEIVAEGTPEQIIKKRKSITGKYLMKELL